MTKNVEIIKPQNAWFDLRLLELWKYRDLILIFARRDIIATYKQTILGPLWFFLAPVFTVVTFTLVFNNIAGISTDGIPAPIFYLAGTIMWNFFQQTFTGISTTFVSNAHIFGKVYFPRLSVPLSLILSSLVKFSIQLLLFLGFWLFYFSKGLIQANLTLMLLPVYVALMALIALGVGILISSLTTKYRDLTYFIGFGLSLLMYATPVIYPASAIPTTYQWFLFANPIAPLIEAFRYSTTGAGNFSIWGLGYSFLFGLVVLFLGLLIFNRTEKTFMDTV
jgi:lipopolysaccharide transport system permease protein